jgi:D-3-phosphoglycerate dehydrogenase
MQITILDDWFDTLCGLPCFQKLAEHDVTIWTDHVQATDALAKRLKNTEILVLFRERTKITGELLDRLPNLKLISQRGVYPHVDVPACTRNNILLCSKIPAGDAPNYAAAELTLGLILAAMRQIPQQMASAKAGKWQMGVGKTLRGRTLGVYGYGRIGKIVAEYARVLGMTVQWWSSEAGRERARIDGENLAESREAFFGESDVVSLHMRLKPETRGIISRKDLRQMRSDALFVNTSRAGLLEPGALLDALNEGRPGMAAVDVFDTEPMTDPSDPLLAHPNLICTPHIGFVTEDEFDKQFGDVFEQIVAYADGNPIHMINPEVWK